MGSFGFPKVNEYQGYEIGNEQLGMICNKPQAFDLPDKLA